MEGTVLQCEYCESLIIGKYLNKTIDFHNFFFCNDSCREQFENLYSKYIYHGDHFEMEL